MKNYDLDALLRHMAELEGSDLYLAVDANPSVLVDGELKQVGEWPLTPPDMEQLCHQALSDQQYKELQEKLEINVA